MGFKATIISILVSVGLFFFGVFQVATSVGRLGVKGFVGYILCTIAVATIICAVLSLIVTKIEEKRIEEKK